MHSVIVLKEKYKEGSSNRGGFELFILGVEQYPGIRNISIRFTTDDRWKQIHCYYVLLPRARNSRVRHSDHLLPICNLPLRY